MNKNKQDLVNQLISQGMKESQAKNFVNAFLNHVKGELESKGIVRIPHLGTMEMITKEPRVGRVSFKAGESGEPRPIPAITRPRFKYTKRFTERVKGL